MMAEMPRHNIRCDDETWNAGAAKAKDQGTTLSTLFRDWLVDYINDETPIPRAIVDAELAVVLQRLMALHNIVRNTEALGG